MQAIGNKLQVIGDSNAANRLQVIGDSQNAESGRQTAVNSRLFDFLPTINYQLSTLLLLLLLFATTYSLQPSAAHADDTGLALYYSFNEGTGATFTDFSGNGRNGVMGFGSPEWGSGKRGNAYYFSNQDRIDSTYSSDATVTTYSAWLYPSGGDELSYVVRESNTDSWGVCRQSGGSCTVTNAVYFHNRRATTDADFYSPAGSLPQNTWTHVAIVYDRSNVANDPVMYINGVSVAVSNPTGNGVGGMFVGGLIGLGSSGGSSNYVGRMDEFRIYTRALGATEIAELYKSGLALQRPSNNLGLVGYWSFDDGAGTRATDFSGRGNHGTLNTFAAPSTADSGWISGKRGKALQFDGTSDFVSMPDINEGTSLLTFSFWVRRDSLATYDGVLSHTNGVSGSDGWWININQDTGDANTGIFIVAINDTDHPASQSSNADVGKWTHITITYSDSANELRFYKNGAYVETVATAQSINDSSSAFRIGLEGSVYGDQYFDGAIDEVRIYNRVLSPAEITALAKTGAVKFSTNSSVLQQGTTLANGLVGHWTFDGADTTWTSATEGTTADKSGNGNTGTLTNMDRKKSVDAGKLGQGMRFDGSATYIAINRDVSDDITLSAWVKTTQTGQVCGSAYWYCGFGIIDGEASGVVNDFGMSLRNGKANFGIGNPDTNIVSVSDINTGTWVLVTATRARASGDIRLYINGVLEASDTAGTQALTAPAGLRIGDILTGTSNLNGILDDARIYNRALTAAEVKQLYSLGQVKITQ